MSSNYGPRAVGSDGSDFYHRERVASHYHASAVNKSRLRFTLVLHIFLVLLMLLRLSVTLCVLAGMRPPPYLQKLRLPKPELWEFAWLASFLATILGFAALPRNRSFVMKQFILGFLVFGIGPVVYGMYTLYDDLKAYYETKETKDLFLGYPRSVLWSMFLLVAVQVHFFSIIFAFKLLGAWSKGERKKKAA